MFCNLPYKVTISTSLEIHDITTVNVQTGGTTGAEAVMSDGTAVIAFFSFIVFMFSNSGY